MSPYLARPHGNPKLAEQGFLEYWWTKASKLEKRVDTARNVSIEIQAQVSSAEAAEMQKAIDNEKPNPQIPGRLKDGSDLDPFDDLQSIASGSKRRRTPALIHVWGHPQAEITCIF